MGDGREKFRVRGIEGRVRVGRGSWGRGKGAAGIPCSSRGFGPVRGPRGGGGSGSPHVTRAESGARRFGRNPRR